MSTRILHDDADIQVLARPGASPFTLVTFADLAFRPGDGAFWARTPAEKLDLDCIGVVARRANWYPAAAIARAAPAIAAAAKPVRIGYGYSMGGYGALKHGRALGLTHALAVAPQASIDPADLRTASGYEYHFRPALHAGMRVAAGDLAPFAAVIADPWDSVDGPHLAALDGLGLHRIVTPFLGHRAVQLLTGSTILARLLDRVRAADHRGLRHLLRDQRRAAPAWAAQLGQAARARRHDAMAERIWAHAATIGLGPGARRIEDAAGLFDRARRLRTAGRDAEAEAALRDGVRLMPKRRVEPLLKAGHGLLQQGEPAAAVALYRAAVALGEDGAALRGLSHALSAAGQAEEALPFAARAVAAAPGEALNHAWQGALLAQLGQRDAAAASLRDALARDAGQVLAHRSLVETLLAAGRRAEAAAALHAARAACPGHPLLDGLLAEEPEGVAPAAPPGLLQRLGAALRRG